MKSYLLAMAFMITCSSIHAENLTLERIHADPALSGPTVSHLTMSPDGRRVTFLKGRDEDRYQLDLWEFNIATNKTARLLDSKKLVPTETISDAEKARRERERTAAFKGISNYSWSPDGQQLLVSLAGNLYLVKVAQPELAKLLVEGDVIDPKISPKGGYVSFVREHNLYTINLSTFKQTQLTSDGAGTIFNGEAEFVAQEEMGQTSGYWWSPDDTQIAFKKFDEAPVANARRFEIYADHTQVIEQRYPAAGEANVVVSLHLVSPNGGAIKEVDLGAEKDIYLVRADWSANARQLLFQRQSRDQKRLDLVAVNVATLQQHIALTETSKTWVALGARPLFLDSKEDSAQQFIWASEQTGRNHLYLYRLENDGNATQLYAISSGNWGIDEVLAVNQKAGWVYVASNKDAVIDKQVYALAMDGSAADKPVRITAANGWHDVKFSGRGEVFIDTWSDTDTPPQISVQRPQIDTKTKTAKSDLVTWILHNQVDNTHPYAPHKAAHVPTEFGTLSAVDGQELHYYLLKPANFDPAKRYPVIVNVYGGPHAQTVARRWGNLFGQYMAQHGYVVFGLDNRGSSRRERSFTDVIYKELGKHEVVDQLTGVNWLAQQSFVDAQKIGVFGWSYGGFMTLRLLEEASDKFALGISVAPVTDWSLYDTHYTEQFLSDPKTNAEGYKNSSVLTHLDGLKSPLLLMHGMADDNVLFTNTTRLIDVMQDRGMQFNLMTYPGGKHGIAKKSHHLHVFKTLVNFFDSHFEVKK